MAILFDLQASAEQPFFLERSGSLPSGKEYELKIREEAYSRRPGELPDDGSRWGIDGGYPRTYCAEFSLSIDGKPVSVQRKLFEDLSHLLAVEVSEDGEDVLVMIRGGDAAGSFRARYSVRKVEIERLVEAGEFPSSVWERTTVHNSVAADAD
jgi:hypothetical protein